MKWLGFFRKKKKKVKQESKPKIISYEKNVIYKVDENAEARMDLWLDDIFNKHHR